MRRRSKNVQEADAEDEQSRELDGQPQLQLPNQGHHGQSIVQGKCNVDDRVDEDAGDNAVLVRTVPDGHGRGPGFVDLDDW